MKDVQELKNVTKMSLELDKRTLKISCRFYSFTIPFCSVITFDLQVCLDPHCVYELSTAENVFSWET